MENIVIIGSSGHAKVIIDILEQEGRFNITGLIDRYRKVGDQTFGYQVLGSEEDLRQLTTSHSLKGVIIAVGDNYTRSKVAAQVIKICPTLTFISAIHPKASIAKDVSIGGGTVIMSGVSVNPCCSIARLCILNTNSCLEHDSTMEEFSSLAPGATIGGGCQIGSYAAICIGATVIHGVTIGEHTLIGAGSTVLKSIESFKVAYGTPAKVIRDRKPWDQYL